MKANDPLAQRPTQRGVILVIALIMLLLLTLLGVSGIRATTMEERMAGNLRDQSLAFQAAEAALRDGENWFATLAAEPEACSSVGTGCDAFAKSVLPDLTLQSAAWWATNAQEKDIDGVATHPHYVREELDFLPDDLTIGHTNPAGRNAYRVTARGTGMTDDAEVLLETTYYKRY